MKAITKKLLLASVTVGVLTPFSLGGGGGLVHAEGISENDIVIDDGIYDIIYGGGDETHSEDSFNNKVTINGGTINGVFGGISTAGNIYGNRIIINGGSVVGVAGGLAYFPYDSDTVAGDVYNNEVIINAGTVGFVSGGEVAYTYASDSGSTLDFSDDRFKNIGNVYNNRVIINGGTVTNGISGGSVLTGSSLSNIIDLYGGTVSGVVTAGEVLNPTENSSVTGNTINIGNENDPSISPDLSGANLIGGLLGDSYSPTGNTLNIYASNVTAKNIAGFGGVNFFVSNSSLEDTSTPILKLTGNNTNLDLDTISVRVPGDSNFNTGDTINLVGNSNGITSSVNSYDATVTKGVTTIYGLNLTNGGTGVTGTVGDLIGKTPNTKNIPTPFSYPEIFIPKTTEIRTDNTDSIGNFYMDDDGYFMDSEDSKAQNVERIQESGHAEIFLNSGGGHLKTKTGDDSFVKANTTNYDLGYAKSAITKSGSTYFAPIVQYSHGNYDSKLRNGTTGSGDTKYVAGGFVLRRMNNNGFYYEGSLRGGKARNNFTADNFVVNDEVQRVNYNMSSPLIATHLRVGKFSRLNKNNILEVYGVAAYSHQRGTDADLSSGEHVNFGAVHSNLERIGYRLTTRTSKASRVYTGMAFQYESNSSSTASGEDWSDSSAGAKGASGMLEVGWQFKPSDRIPIMLDMYATGWVGHQSGFTAMAKFKKTF